MTRHFFTFALLGLLLSWLAMYSIKLEPHQVAALNAQLAKSPVDCRQALTREYAEKYAIAPSSKYCVSIIPVEIKREVKLERRDVKVSSLSKTADTAVAALPTRIWRMQNEWFKLVQALCQPTHLKEVLNPITGLRNSQKKYQEGAYHWRPSQVQLRRTASFR